MKELDYQPNALVKKHTNTIGMIVPQINHPFFCWLIECVEAAADAKGFCDECDSQGITHVEIQSEKLAHEFKCYEECIRENIKKHTAVDGVFAGGDMIATVTSPTITTLRQPIEEMAELSIDYIIKVLKNKVVPMNTVLPVELIKREST